MVALKARVEKLEMTLGRDRGRFDHLSDDELLAEIDRLDRQVLAALGSDHTGSSPAERYAIVAEIERLSKEGVTNPDIASFDVPALMARMKREWHDIADAFFEMENNQRQSNAAR